jgi:hypothetical protein
VVSVGGCMSPDPGGAGRRSAFRAVAPRRAPAGSARSSGRGSTGRACAYVARGSAGVAEVPVAGWSVSSMVRAIVSIVAA